MRRFRFRLQPVLRLRSQLERNARRDLATAMGAVHDCEQQLAAATRGLDECAGQAVRTDAVGQLARALENGLRRHHWRVSRQKRAADQRLEVARGEYLQRTRDVRSLDRLREQALAEWRTEAQRREQAEIDEMATLTRARAGQDGEAASGEARWD